MKNAIATTRGWVHPKTGELLKAQKMTQEKADKLNGVKPEPVKPAPIVEPTPVIDPIVEEEEEEKPFF